MRTVIYVDGFHLYYVALKLKRCKRLDWLIRGEKTLPKHHKIRKIKYFNARVSATNTTYKPLI